MWYLISDYYKNNLHHQHKFQQPMEIRYGGGMVICIFFHKTPLEVTFFFYTSMPWIWFLWCIFILSALFIPISEMTHNTGKTLRANLFSYSSRLSICFILRIWKLSFITQCHHRQLKEKMKKLCYVFFCYISFSHHIHIV